MRINIKPHEGINDVSFGQSSEEVRLTLGAPESTREESINRYGKVGIREPKTDYYFDNSLQISYDENDTVEFIEIACKNSNLQISLYGVNINKICAAEIISFLTQKKKLVYDKNNIELPYSYDFISKNLSFWRQVVPEHENDEDGRYFDSVAIGRSGYLEE